MKKAAFSPFLGLSILMHLILVLLLAFTCVLPLFRHAAPNGEVYFVTLTGPPPGTHQEQQRSPAGRPQPSPRTSAPVAEEKPSSPAEDHAPQATGELAVSDYRPSLQQASLALGTAGPPPSGASPAQGTAEASSASYRSLIFDIISKNRLYPQSARRRGLEGTVDILFTIDKTGRASEVQVVRTSGVGILDRAGIQTIRACTFPPPPREAVTLPASITFRLIDTPNS